MVCTPSPVSNDLFARTDILPTDEFDPDCFLNEQLHTHLAPKPFIFLPSNAGPRVCLGQQFAYDEMSFMLIRLQSFSSVIPHPAAQHLPTDWAQTEGRKSREQFWSKIHLPIYAVALYALWVRMTEIE